MSNKKTGRPAQMILQISGLCARRSERNENKVIGEMVVDTTSAQTRAAGSGSKVGR
jgi:hypothetical protein